MQRTLEPDGTPQNGGDWLDTSSPPQPASVKERTNCCRIFAPSRRFDPNDPELMDRPDVNKAWLREELETLEKLNRLGGHQLMLRYICHLLGSKNMGVLNVLDLATGAADIPRAIVSWARKKNLKIRVTAVDGNQEVLRSAREWCQDWPEIQLECCDLLQLPHARESFDIVLCSLALHHFRTEDAVRVLRRMNDIARLGYIVNDLQRNWLTIWASEVLARTLMRSPIVRNDGPQSFRAAFTVAELQGMAEQAGMRSFRIKRHQGIFRMVLSGRKE